MTLKSSAPTTKVTQAAKERCAANTLQEQLAAHREQLKTLCHLELLITAKRIDEHYKTLMDEMEKPNV